MKTPTKAQKKATAIVILRRISDSLNLLRQEIGNTEIYNSLQAQENKINLVINNICEL